MAPLFAILAAVSLAFSTVLIRRGSLSGSPLFGVFAATFLGPIFFVILALFGNELGKIADLPWEAYLLFGVAGIVHIVLGRFLFYSAVELIGGSRSSVVVTVSPLVSVAIAIPIFGESISWMIGLGAFVVILGPVLIALGEGSLSTQQARESNKSIPWKLFVRGALFALGAAIFWGISPALVQGGLNAASLPIMGLLLSSMAAVPLLLISLSNPSVRTQLAKINMTAAAWYFAAAIAVNAAQTFFFFSLNAGGVILPVLLIQTTVLFVIALSLIINREVEALNKYVVAGGVLVVLGAGLLIVG